MTKLKIDVSSANSLALLFHLLGISLTYIRKRRGPNMDPSGAPARISLHDSVLSYHGDLFITPYSVRMPENADQRKLLIWTHFTQC